MERKPDFEDDKMRMWIYKPEAGDKAGAGDPTVMPVDINREELYESRLYRLRPGPETLAKLVDIATTPHRNLPPLPRPIASGIAGEFMQQTICKFLSKRDKGTGEISLLVTAVAFDRRFLLRPLRTMTEEQYRNKVADFEAEWVGGGYLELGPVTTLEEWRRYAGHLGLEDKQGRERKRRKRRQQRPK